MAATVDYGAVLAAAARLHGVAHRTPVLSSRLLNEHFGRSLHFKCENFQITGAFKFRGAYNAISQLKDEERTRGVLAYSSGNHAQAVARVAQMLGLAATIVMPIDAPRSKRAATEAYGAHVIGYDPQLEKREEIAARIQREEGQILIPPFDHPQIVAGQGTAALELLQDRSQLQLLLVPCGGGGLLSGSALAAHGISPTTRVVGVEPALADDATRSFRSGVLQSVEHPQTIADGTRTASMSELTFGLVRRYVSDMVTVSEQAIVDAVAWIESRMKLVVEPSAALPLAALIEHPALVGQEVGLMLSGGNVDLT